MAHIHSKIANPDYKFPSIYLCLGKKKKKKGGSACVFQRPSFVFTVGDRNRSRVKEQVQLFSISMASVKVLSCQFSTDNLQIRGKMKAKHIQPSRLRAIEP